ncbi:MAG: hypothetical protein WCU80_03275 [Paludibacteraceae bacterium]
MKKTIFLLLSLLMGANLYISTYAQELKPKVEYNDPDQPTSMGIIIYSNDIETVWNALRLANYSQEWGNAVTVYLLGKGVEVEGLMQTNNDIKEQMETFLSQNGVVLGCQTCFANRDQVSKICKVACIQDLYETAKKNKVVLTF